MTSIQRMADLFHPMRATYQGLMRDLDLQQRAVAELKRDMKRACRRVGLEEFQQYHEWLECSTRGISKTCRVCGEQSWEHTFEALKACEGVLK